MSQASRGAEKSVGRQPVRRADDRARTSLQMREHLRTHRLVIAGQVELGDRPAPAVGRPQHFVWLGDPHPHHASISVVVFRDFRDLAGFVLTTSRFGAVIILESRWHRLWRLFLPRMNDLGRDLCLPRLWLSCAPTRPTVVSQHASLSPSCANSSRCFISSQLVLLPPLRSCFIRTNTQLPWSARR